MFRILTDQVSVFGLFLQWFSRVEDYFIHQPEKLIHRCGADFDEFFCAETGTDEV